MVSTAPSGWRLLKTSSSSKSKKQKTCPKLFCNFSATPEDGITLFLTDLISLWRCFVSREQIISTSTEQHASIDPSENTEQMRIFLDKLALALHEATNHLVKDSPNATDLHSLILRTTIELPKPLKPLEWTFTLSPQPASALAEYILRPTLHQSSIGHEKIENMLDIIKEKDHVIERLLDRVAEKGVDMSLIFPTLTGTAKRGGSGVKVDDAKRLVPGMKAFRRDEWEGKFQQHELTGTEIGLSELVKGCEKCFDHPEEDHSQAMSSWVQRLPGVESLASGSSRSFMNKSQSQSQSQLRGLEDTESENEFETQATPPQLTKKRRTPDTNESDDSEGQPDAKKLKAENSKIGALGRKSRSKTPIMQTQANSSSPVQPARSPQRLKRKTSAASAATETASESDNEAKTNTTKQSLSKQSRLGSLKPSASKSPQPQHSSSPSRPRTAESNSSQPRKLGRIGKNRQSTASPIPGNTAKDEESNTAVLVKSSQPTPSTPSRKLGRIGLRNKTSPATNDARVTASPVSTRTKQNETVDESDATASPSPSPSPSPHAEKVPTGSQDGKSIGRSNTSSPQHPTPRTKYLMSRSQLPMAVPQASSALISSPNDRPKEEQKEEGKRQQEGEVPEETETQKLDRRRNELKKNIAAGGAKKKRRF